MDYEKSMEFENDNNFEDNEKSQMDMFGKTLRPSSFEPPKPKSRSSSVQSSQRNRLASSSNFQLSTKNKNFMSSNFDLKSAMASTNDFKYMGDQFKVGQINPNLQSSTEKHFQKLYGKKLGYLYENTRYLNMTLTPSMSQTNDSKWNGIQFRMGQFTNPDGIGMTFEQRFQKMFKTKLDMLTPKPKPMQLTYEELKQMHEFLKPK